MDLFGYLFALEGYGYGRGHWYGSNEKSKHAKGREEEATKKFDAMRMTMEATMIETTINEARAEGSNSHLKHLPNDALNNVYGYLLGKEFENNEDAEISDQITKSIPKIDRRIVKKGDKKLQFGVDFSDLSLYEPGEKITIPLTMPNFHLTQACFRDLKKHVVKNSGWDLKRVECTEKQKKQHKIKKKSKAYFVNATYQVPGKKSKKKKASATKKAASTSVASASKKTASTSAASASASAPASAPETKKRAATATKATKVPTYKVNPAATAALQAVLASAQDGDGVVDPAILQQALKEGQLRRPTALQIIIIKIAFIHSIVYSLFIVFANVLLLHRNCLLIWRDFRIHT